MNNTQNSQEGQLLSLEQERVKRDLENNITNPHAKELAKQFKSIEPDVLSEANKVMQDPNKMKDPAYQQWVKCLAKGRFPKKGKHALHFLRSIAGTPNEQKYARKLMGSLSDNTSGSLSERVEKDHLKTLHILREKDVQQETLEKTQSTTSSIIFTAETRQRIQKTIEVKKDTWEFEPPNEKLKEKIGAIDKERLAVFQKSNAVSKELAHEQSQEKKDESKIKALTKKLEDLDNKIDALNEKVQPLRQREADEQERALTCRKIIQNLSDSIYVKDIRKITQLITWENTDSGRKNVEGLVVNVPSGTNGKSFIKIRKIYFERKKGADPTDPGELKIDYEDEEGTPCNKMDRNYRTFTALVRASKAYEPINTLEEFSERADAECGYKLPEAGQEYDSEVTDNFIEDFEDNKPEKPYLKKKIESFKIERVHQMNGVHHVVLDRKVGDYDTKILNLGQFSRLLKKYNFKRKYTSQEDLQQSLEKRAEAIQKECAAFVQDASPEQQELFAKLKGVPDKKDLLLHLPKPGEEKKIIYHDPETGKPYIASLKTEQNGGEEDYLVEYETNTVGKHLPIPNDSTNVVPMFPAKPQVVKKRLNRRSFQELSNKDAVREIAGPLPPSPAELEPTRSASMPTEEDAQQMIKEEKAKPAEKLQEDLQKKIYKEALDYEKINKVGDFAREDVGFLKSLWIQTRVLSCGDLWELGKASYEYYIRRFERRQKERYSSVAKEVPFFAPEMQRINQQAETDQVNQFKEAFDQFGVDQIQDRLRNTKNRDEMKAAFITLCEKGQMRWDDIEAWDNLNRFITDPALKIPIPRNGDPYTKLDEFEGDTRTGFDFLKEGIDSLWGQGQYNDWYRQTKSAYIQNARGFYEKGKELENLQGGHERRLSHLLRLHKGGTWVDPQEYEGLILHAIEMGKSSMQAKLYFMVEGAAAKNPSGQTILSFDRIAHINSEMLPRFPILEYMTARATRPSKTKAGVESHRFTKDDYERWVDIFDNGNPGDPNKCAPGEAVNDFLWKYVIPSDDTQNRINKAIRNGENLDHDDMFAYLPPASEGIITDACKSTTGSKKFFTVEGYANAFPGFSQYIRSLGQNDRKNKLMEAIKSYVRFEGIITDKFEKATDKAHDSYQRFDTTTLRSPTIVSDEPPKYFIDNLNATIQKIIAAYNDPELNDIADKIYNLSQTVSDISQPADKERQNKVNHAYSRFGDVFNGVVLRDKGQKMIDIINSADLPDMPYRPTTQRERKQADFVNELSIE